jgi:DNA-binding GntR family transcriptional regulator
VSGNQYLARALDVICAPQFSHVLVKSFNRQTLNLVSVVQEHRDWLTVLTTTDADTCAAYTRRMMESFRQQVLDSVECGSNVPEPKNESATPKFAL